ncbi:hypothetical protein BYT27DRAFT_6702766 [Phlegmacium glaucopus]|nr:hypothetical protein BYT27DRAFT_6702766 [Phlegmacium glaucopus]
MLIYDCREYIHKPRQNNTRSHNQTETSRRLAIKLFVWLKALVHQLNGPFRASVNAPPIPNQLDALWPCPVVQQKCDSLRQQLVDACTSTNFELPFPPTLFHLPCDPKWRSLSRSGAFPICMEHSDFY